MQMKSLGPRMRVLTFFRDCRLAAIAPLVLIAEPGLLLQYQKQNSVQPAHWSSTYLYALTSMCIRSLYLIQVPDFQGLQFLVIAFTTFSIIHVARILRERPMT
jgi:hypothetical protein